MNIPSFRWLSPSCRATACFMMYTTMLPVTIVTSNRFQSAGEKIVMVRSNAAAKLARRGRTRWFLACAYAPG